MSTTKSLTVRKGFPYQVRARAEGYFDLAENYTFNEDGESVTETMTAYNGLDMSYSASYQSADTLDFSNTVLPWKWQYSVSLATDKFCLMPIGQTYENITETSGATPISLQGCTYNFEDDGSATTLNCFVVNGDEGIVLTPDNSYNIPAQQGGFFNGAIFFSHNPEVELGFLGVYDSNGDLKWQWDGNYNVVGDLFVSENEEGIVTTAGYENGSYIETQDAFTFEPGDTWEAGVRFLCLVIGSQQTVMSSKGFELGVDQNGHPYGTFYGVGTITLTDITLGLGDEADISCWYSDDNDGYGVKYHLQSTLHNRAGHAEDVMLNSAGVESGEKVSFGCFQISGEQNGWLLGTVSIPSHTVYEYDNGTWTEANNA